MKKKWWFTIISLAIPIIFLVLGICLPSLGLFIAGFFLFGFAIVGNIFLHGAIAGAKYERELKESGEEEEAESEYNLSNFINDYINPCLENGEEGQQLDEKTIEETELEAINESYGTNNLEAQAKRYISNQRRAKAALEDWPKNYWGCYVIIAFLLCLIATLVLLCMLLITQLSKFLTWVLIMFGSCAIPIIIAAICVTTLEKVSINRAKKYNKTINYEWKSKFLEEKAVVFMTLLSSQTTIGSGRHRGTGRICGVCYKVLLECNDKKLTAYSKKFYNQNDIVTIIYKENSKLASIIDDNYSENFEAYAEDEIAPSGVNNNKEIEPNGKE